VVAGDDPYSFLDVDNGIDPTTGQPKPWAEAVVRQFPSYWELSPSGSGLKGLIHARPPRNRIIRLGDGQVEIFYSGKYTTLTGHRIDGTPPAIQNCQAELDAFLVAQPEPAANPDARPRPATPSNLRDDDVMQRARAARNGAKFARLFDRGDTVEYDDDHSRADQALVSLLAFWTQDPDQIDRLLRRSALCRGKWTDRADYRERTTARALARGDVYSAPGSPLGLRTRRLSLRIREATHA
jgi:primase-polymerase (primpol)-like protein